MENRTDTWPSHRDVRAASGREVEAAANVILPPGGETLTGCGCSHMHDHHHHHLHEQTPSKVDQLKTRSMEMVNDIKSRSVETANQLKQKSLVTANQVKQQSLLAADKLKREMNIRKAQARLSMARAQSSARVNSKIQVDRMNSSMRTEPMKWAGIAAGSGVVLGLIGRYFHWRATRPTPNVVIIEACS